MGELLVATYEFRLATVASMAWKEVADTCPGLSTNRWRPVDSEEPDGRLVTVIGEDNGPKNRASFTHAIEILSVDGELIDVPGYVIAALVAKRERVAGTGRRVVRHRGGIVLHADGTNSPLNRPQG